MAHYTLAGMGTKSPPFEPTRVKEPNGTTDSYQTITSQYPYHNYSVEELRLADYNLGQRYGNTAANKTIPVPQVGTSAVPMTVDDIIASCQARTQSIGSTKSGLSVAFGFGPPPSIINRPNNEMHWIDPKTGQPVEEKQDTKETTQTESTEKSPSYCFTPYTPTPSTPTPSDVKPAVKMPPAPSTPPEKEHVSTKSDGKKAQQTPFTSPTATKVEIRRTVHEMYIGFIRRLDHMPCLDMVKVDEFPLIAVKLHEKLQPDDKSQEENALSLVAQYLETFEDVLKSIERHHWNELAAAADHYYTALGRVKDTVVIQILGNEFLAKYKATHRQSAERLNRLLDRYLSAEEDLDFKEARKLMDAEDDEDVTVGLRSCYALWCDWMRTSKSEIILGEV